MKQLLQNMRDGKTIVEDVPVPAPREGTALVRVAASLVSSGTERMLVEFAEKSLVGKARSRPDLVKQVLQRARRDGVRATAQAAFNRLDQPMSLGYSSAGTIAALGKNMRGFKVGQRVACAGGGYAVHAEYNLVPRNLLTALPQDVDFDSAAFTTLGAIAMHGFRLAETQLGEDVAVIGLGLVGLLMIQIAAAAGCNVLGIDIDPRRTKLAASLGLQAVARPKAESASRAFTSERGFDAVIICADTSANDPIELAGLIARQRGRVVATGAVGLNLPRKLYYEKEIAFINSRSYGPGRYDAAYEENGIDYPLGYVRWTEGRNFESVLSLMQDGKLNVRPLITHRFPIEQATKAYELITGKKRESFLGVLVTYPVRKSHEASRIQFSSSVARRSSSSVINLGVLGAGLYANATLLPILKKSKDFALVGIASAGGMHAQFSGKKFRFKYAASSADELLKDKTIDALAILTRHDSHADLAMKALKAGKNVFVEKPLAINSTQLSAINKLLKADSCPLLTVGYNRRFSNLGSRLHAFLADRTQPLHAHYRINAGALPTDHWTHDPRIGGGRIIGEACHFIDFITFLVGSAPISVRAHSLPGPQASAEDNVSMTFSFPDGSIGVVDYLSNGSRVIPKERFEVFCGGRVAILDDFVSLQLIEDDTKKDFTAAQDKGWANELAAFASAIHAGGPPPIPYEQLIAVTQCTFAALESIREKRSIDI